MASATINDFEVTRMIGKRHCLMREPGRREKCAS
jgi:hypothetical protein